MSYVDLISLERVQDKESFAEFARQHLGIPIFRKDVNILGVKAKEFFEDNPRADWRTLGRTVQWCKTKKFRPNNLYAVISCARHAWADGMLPELDCDEDEQLEADITAALQVETDPYWRRALIASQGSFRKEAYLAWLAQRKVSA